jgi:hypothetical protein
MAVDDGDEAAAATHVLASSFLAAPQAAPALAPSAAAKALDTSASIAAHPAVAPQAVAAPSVAAAPATVAAPATAAAPAAVAPSGSEGAAPSEDAVPLSPTSLAEPRAPPAKLKRGASLDVLGSELVQSRVGKQLAAETADPEGEHRAVKARLKAFESAYEQEHGSKPRTREAWGDMWPEYERYAVLRASMRTDGQ